MAVLAKYMKSPAEDLFSELEPILRKYFTFPDGSLKKAVLTIEWGGNIPTLETLQHADQADAAKFRMVECE